MLDSEREFGLQDVYYRVPSGSTPVERRKEGSKMGRARSELRFKPK